MEENKDKSTPNGQQFNDLLDAAQSFVTNVCRSLVVGSVALMLSSCSWLTDFVVVNRGESVVLVTYRVKDPGQFDEGVRFRDFEWPPRIVPAEGMDGKRGFGNGGRAPLEVVPDEAGDIVVELPPDHALLIATQANFDYPDLETWESFPIESIVIESERGTLRYCGPGLLMTFQGSRFLRRLDFTGSPSQMASGFCDQNDP